ncbi:hypothetical protein Dsin_019166 [Dipteronia sinensis]|uniref:Reverse transcriptase n=1 Tax=Dipteronia sinensis TaxID=43782 RepID=A0AAE0E2H3_9ROSI|nr:hypothetical protein Dsin_019166 [Dipteronia sinensis]
MRDVVSKVNRFTKNLDMWNQDHRQVLKREIKKKKEELAIASNVVELHSWKAVGNFQSCLPSNNYWDEVIDSVPTRLSNRGSAFLDFHFSVAEVKKAVFDMSSAKASGIDGMSTLFYQKNWDIMGDCVTSARLQCLSDGDSLEDVNGTPITLIPKIPYANRITDFCHISMCTVIYKVVVKPLANRLCVVLGDVIQRPRVRLYRVD